MSTEDWTVDWQQKTATHADGLKLKFIPQEEFNRTYQISPREGRRAVSEPEGWMRLVIDGLKGDRPVNVDDIHELLLSGQSAFLEEAHRHGDEKHA
jgi:hypothetical protein